MPFDSSKFYVGVNIGWLTNFYGHDLGTAFGQPTWGPIPNSRFDPYIEKVFLHLKLRRIKVVRFFIFDGLEGISYTLRGAVSEDASDFSSFTPELYLYDNDFLNRVVRIMQVAQNNQIQVYWTLFDGTRLLPPPYGSRSELEKGSMAYMIQFLSSSLFIENVLSALNRIIIAYQENIFAVDLCNEVDWLWTNSVPRISIRTVVSFINSLYINIKREAPDIQITASFANHSELSRQHAEFSFLDFFDFHRYYDRLSPSTATDGHGALPTWDESRFSDKKCIIGEIGNYHTGSSLDTPTGDSDSFGEQNTATRLLLDQALAGGYFGALAWRYTSFNGREGGSRGAIPNDFIMRLLKKGNRPEHFRRTQDQFLDAFIAVSASATSTPDVFQDFERPVWSRINQFIDGLDPSRVPSLPPP